MSTYAFGVWGRAAVVAVLGVALWDPGLPGLRAPTHVVLLLDESASMPRGQVDAAWRSIAPVVARLSPESRVSVIRFAEDTAREVLAAPVGERSTRELLAQPSPPRRLALADQQTDIAGALADAFRLASRQLPLAVVVASDGRATVGDTREHLRLAAQSNVRVSWWRPLPAPGRKGDAWIAALDAPRQLRDGASAPVRILVSADAAVDRGLQIRDNGRLMVRRNLSLVPDKSETLSFRLELPGGGLHEVSAELLGDDRVAGNNRRRALVSVTGPVNVLLLSDEPPRSLVRQSLEEGGWPITSVAPRGFSPALLDGHRVIILDQLSAAALPAADWESIGRAVRINGTGLIVLGGPGTFGAGSYRHSVLEELLPVLAEAPKTLPPASVLFAVDKSGSMEQPTHVGAARLDLARRAVVESARDLAPADQAGLIVFDMEPRILLPLARRQDQTAAIGAVWDFSAGGGTRLEPVLQKGSDMLAAAATDQRLLVLATDGRFADPERLPAMEAQLRNGHITLVAIAIGVTANSNSLERLTQATNGRLLLAKDATELPELMATEVQSRRSPVGQGPVTPRLARELPFAPEISGAWPPVAAYQVTRPRGNAEVYLTTPTGEPLLAAGFSGVGRVIALPAGLGRWTQEWIHWKGWGPFLGGLVQWSAAADANPRLHLRVDDHPQALKLAIDALDGPGDWSGADAVPIEVRDPAMRWQRLHAYATAPGHYQLTVPAAIPGRYDLRVGWAGAQEAQAVWHESLAELLPPQNDTRALENLAAEGLVERWSPSTGIPAPHATGGSRDLFTIGALGLLLLTLVFERARWRHIRALANRTGIPLASFRRSTGTRRHAQ